VLLPSFLSFYRCPGSPSHAPLTLQAVRTTRLLAFDVLSCPSPSIRQQVSPSIFFCMLYSHLFPFSPLQPLYFKLTSYVYDVSFLSYSVSFALLTTLQQPLSIPPNYPHHALIGTCFPPALANSDIQYSDNCHFGARMPSLCLKP